MVATIEMGRGTRPPVWVQVLVAALVTGVLWSQSSSDLQAQDPDGTPSDAVESSTGVDLAAVLDAIVATGDARRLGDIRARLIGETDSRSRAMLADAGAALGDVTCLRLLVEELDRGNDEVIVRLLERRLGCLSNTVAGATERDAWFSRVQDLSGEEWAKRLASCRGGPESSDGRWREFGDSVSALELGESRAMVIQSLHCLETERRDDALSLRVRELVDGLTSVESESKNPRDRAGPQSVELQAWIAALWEATRDEPLMERVSPMWDFFRRGPESPELKLALAGIPAAEALAVSMDDCHPVRLVYRGGYCPSEWRVARRCDIAAAVIGEALDVEVYSPSTTVSLLSNEDPPTRRRMAARARRIVTLAYEGDREALLWGSIEGATDRQVVRALRELAQRPGTMERAVATARRFFHEAPLTRKAQYARVLAECGDLSGVRVVSTALSGRQFHRPGCRDVEGTGAWHQGLADARRLMMEFPCR